MSAIYLEILDKQRKRVFGELPLASILDIAADKAATIGRRAVWRDYVDIFFLLKKQLVSLKELIKSAQEKFKGEFNDLLFLEQLVFFKDLPVTRTEFLQEKYSPLEIKKYLRKEVKQYLNMNIKFDDFLSQFFALEIVPGKKVRIPYWHNKFFKRRGRIQGLFGGKGTPAQIKQATLKKAKQAGIDLNKMASVQIRGFMRQKRIGLDCSGFAFQILNFLQPGFYKRLKKAKGISFNPIRRFNARALTSSQNSKPVKKTKNIKVGDLIPVSFSDDKIDHILVVVKASGKEIIYAHSSKKTKVTGPHLGKIKVINPNLGLEKQHWLEKTKRSLSLLEFARQPLKKLGAKRVI